MSGELFYILVEGEPDSPELAFLEEKISGIFSEHNVPLVPQLFEVGGSGAFSNASLCKTFYKLSKAHSTKPVLAIADSDYRTSEDKEFSADDSNLIAARKAKVLYWQRHEWENYLLDETQLIADFVNQFPKVAKKSTGYSKRSDEKLTKGNLDEQIKKYFSASIKSEFFECLKFNLNTKIEKYSSIKKPDNFDNNSVDEIEVWFLSTAQHRAITIKPIREKLYQDILEEYNWLTIINQPDELDFDFAKKRFRGKECFANLVDFINASFSCNINTDRFKHDILKKLRNDSAIIIELKDLLLKELP